MRQINQIYYQRIFTKTLTITVRNGKQKALIQLKLKDRLKLGLLSAN
jgi:hypothetical protein